MWQTRSTRSRMSRWLEIKRWEISAASRRFLFFRESSGRRDEITSKDAPTTRQLCHACAYIKLSLSLSCPLPSSFHPYLPPSLTFFHPHISLYFFYTVLLFIAATARSFLHHPFTFLLSHSTISLIVIARFPARSNSLTLTMAPAPFDNSVFASLQPAPFVSSGAPFQVYNDPQPQDEYQAYDPVAYHAANGDAGSVSFYYVASYLDRTYENDLYSRHYSSLHLNLLCHHHRLLIRSRLRQHRHPQLNNARM